MRSNDTNKIIVVGIPKSMEDDGLNELFSTFGSIVSAKVVKDPKGESRGFGFVSFTSSAACKTAIKDMDKKPFEQRVLNVRHVVPKEQREAQIVPATTNDLDKPVCWKFKKGLCTAGKACEFSHQVEAGAHGTCFEFLQQGKCKRGDKCKFSHLTPEGTVVEQLPTKTETKRVCFAFQKGTCHRGSKCMFAHETLKSVEVPVAKTQQVFLPESDAKTQLRELIDQEKAAKEMYRVAKRKRESFEKELRLDPSGVSVSTDKEEEPVAGTAKMLRKQRKEAKKMALQRLQTSDTLELE